MTVLRRNDSEIARQSDEAAFRAARQLCRSQSRDLRLASLFLPRAKRDGVLTILAFARMVRSAIAISNAVDHCGEILREKIDEIFGGVLNLPQPQFRSPEQHVLEALRLVVGQYQIPRQYFLDLVEGARMEGTIPRYATWSALEKLCDALDGNIAAIASCILGLTHSEGHQRAIILGRAIRLTDILRKLKADCGRGRIFLPLEDMARFRYTERDLGGAVVNGCFRELMRFEISRARQFLRDAAEGICWLVGDGARLTVSLIAVAQASLLTTIERRDYDVFTRPVELSLIQKISLMPRALRLAYRQADEPLPDVFG